MATLKKHFWGAREELQQACHQIKRQQLSAENIEPEDGFGRHDKSCQNWTCGNHTPTQAWYTVELAMFRSRARPSLT